jgi:hypothetical protein
MQPLWGPMSLWLVCGVAGKLVDCRGSASDCAFSQKASTVHTPQLGGLVGTALLAHTIMPALAHWASVAVPTV